MMQNRTANSASAVDVIEEFDYRNHADSYNDALKQWRKNENNDYVFRCRKRAREAVYVEGKGYHAPTPAIEERRAIIRINIVLGVGILSYLLIETLLSVILMGVFQLLGIDVGYTYSDSTFYGNQTAVLVILMLESLLKYLVPILIFHLFFKMPLRVGCRIRPHVAMEIPASAAITMAVFAVTNFWLLFSSANILSYSTLGTAYYAVSYMRPLYQSIYLLYELLIITSLTEVMLHGEAFHVLRQFGDWFAVLVTTVLAVCAAHSLVTMMMELTFSLVTGVAVLRSGSLLPAMGNRILYRILLFLLFGLEISPSRTLYRFRPWFLLIVLLVGVIGIAIFARPNRKDVGLVTQKSYLSVRERIQMMLHLGPLSIVFFLCIALMVIEVVF